MTFNLGLYEVGKRKWVTERLPKLALQNHVRILLLSSIIDNLHTKVLLIYCIFTCLITQVLQLLTCNKTWKISMHWVPCIAKSGMLNKRSLRPYLEHTIVHFNRCHISRWGYVIQILTQFMTMSGKVLQWRTTHFLDNGFGLRGSSVESLWHFRSLINIDATHLNRKYTRKLLIAVTYNVDNKKKLFCFAFVESKIATSWTWFLKHLYQHVTEDQCPISIIYDHHEGIKGVVTMVFLEP